MPYYPTNTKKKLEKLGSGDKAHIGLVVDSFQQMGVNIAERFLRLGLILHRLVMQNKQVGSSVTTIGVTTRQIHGFCFFRGGGIALRFQALPC